MQNKQACMLLFWSAAGKKKPAELVEPRDFCVTLIGNGPGGRAIVKKATPVWGGSYGD